MLRSAAPGGRPASSSAVRSSRPSAGTGPMRGLSGCVTAAPRTKLWRGPQSPTTPPGPPPNEAVAVTLEPYYRRGLAFVHHEGFGFHADATAPGILTLLAGVRERGGLVLEVGCGSGLLTKHLADAGHRVVATDASPAML